MYDELDYKTPTATIVTIASNEIVAIIFFDVDSFLDCIKIPGSPIKSIAANITPIRFLIIISHPFC